jgi:hypothetical protein
VKEPPWLSAPALEVVALILVSHQAAFGRPLLAGTDPLRNLRLAAQEVFAADQAVLAHDGAEDPRLIYANAAAIKLWRRPWAEMIGLPSRMTAEALVRKERAQALALAQLKEALEGYGGIRIDRFGHRFQIRGARIWTLRDRQSQARGQGACFSTWWRI